MKYTFKKLNRTDKAQHKFVLLDTLERQVWYAVLSVPGWDILVPIQ